jgi:hypothetical protein
MADSPPWQFISISNLPFDEFLSTLPLFTLPMRRESNPLPAIAQLRPKQAPRPPEQSQSKPILTHYMSMPEGNGVLPARKQENGRVATAKLATKYEKL